MTITIEQLQNALVRYIDAELYPKATNWGKFTLCFIAPSIPNLVNTKVKEFKATDMLNDMFDEHGNIELNELYNRTKQAMEKVGKLYIPKIDYYADIADVEKLYSMLKSM